MKISLKPIAATAVVVIAAAISQARADSSQTLVTNGWSITYPGNITLTVVPGGSPSTLALTKDVTFSSNVGAIISFVQVATDASPTIVFNDEHVTNDTGTDWGGFGFLLADPFGPSAGATFASAGQVFNPTTPFTATDFSKQIVTLSGGVLPTNSTFEWGSSIAGNGLVIDAVQGVSSPTTFSFKEIPFEGQAVPLPAAAWTALSGLGGLWLLAGLRSKKAKTL